MSHVANYKILPIVCYNYVTSTLNKLAMRKRAPGIIHEPSMHGVTSSGLVITRAQFHSAAYTGKQISVLTLAENCA